MQSLTINSIIVDLNGIIIGTHLKTLRSKNIDAEDFWVYRKKNSYLLLSQIGCHYTLEVFRWNDINTVSLLTSTPNFDPESMAKILYKATLELFDGNQLMKSIKVSNVIADNLTPKKTAKSCTN